MAHWIERVLREYVLRSLRCEERDLGSRPRDRISHTRSSSIQNDTSALNYISSPSLKKLVKLNLLMSKPGHTTSSTSADLRQRTPAALSMSLPYWLCRYTASSRIKMVMSTVLKVLRPAMWRTNEYRRSGPAVISLLRHNRGASLSRLTSLIR